MIETSSKESRKLCSNNKTILEASNLAFKYTSMADDEPFIIDNLSFELKAGEIIKLSGRNGAGKSTLLKLLDRQIKPSSGKLSFIGDQHTAYLDQNAWSSTADSLTVKEQLSMSMSNIDYENWRQVDPKKNVISILEKYAVGLEDKMNSFMDELSGGQRQIIALLCVLLRKTSIVLLDEFSSSMDPHSNEVSNYLIETASSKDGLAVIYVEHGASGPMYSFLLKI